MQRHFWSELPASQCNEDEEQIQSKRCLNVEVPRILESFPLSSPWLRSGVTSRSSRSRSFALSVTRWTRSQPWKWRNGGLVSVSSCVTWRSPVCFVIWSRPEGRSLPSPSRWPRGRLTFRGGCSRELPRAQRQESSVKITSFRLGGSRLTKFQASYDTITSVDE